MNCQLSSSSSLYRDLYFTLGTPLTQLSVEKEKQLPRHLLDIKCCSVDEGDFYDRCSKRIRIITSLLNEISSPDSNAILNWIYSWFLPGKIQVFLTDILKHASEEKIDLETAQKIYVLAQDVKRHESNRSSLWNALSKTHQLFLHFLSSWTANLNVLSESIHYQWLGDGRMERAKDNAETITDFGNGSLFKVQPPSQQGTHYDFPLVDFPDFKIVKASPYRKQSADVFLFAADQTLDAKAIGRLTEIFDVQTLEQEIRKRKEDSLLYINQLFDVFSCYRSGLCSVLNLPVCLPLAIERQGKWAIWPKAEKKPLKTVPLTPSMIADLHQLFHIEKLWRMNIFNGESSLPHPVFMVCNERLFVDGVLPLPHFLTQDQDIERRHKCLFRQLSLDSVSLEHWNRLEEASKMELEKLADISQGLHTLLAQQKLALQDLVNLDPQALLVVRLIRQLNRHDLSHYPVHPDLFFHKAYQMLSPLLSKKETDSIPYTYGQAMQQNGAKITEQLLNAKRELKTFILLAVMEKFTKKETVEDCIQSVLQMVRETCQEIAEQLNQSSPSNWSLKEKMGDHFMLLFGREWLNELNDILRQPLDENEHLSNQLILLREAASDSQADLQKANQKLHSVLHDAMVKKYSQAFLTDIQLQISSIDVFQNC